MEGVEKTAMAGALAWKLEGEEQRVMLTEVDGNSRRVRRLENKNSARGGVVALSIWKPSAGELL